MRMRRASLMEVVMAACVLLSVFPCSGVCFSRGASVSSCESMSPGHISTFPQHTHSHTHLQSAVSIRSSRSVYLPEHTLTVTVQSSRLFMGFLLQARSVLHDRVLSGHFTLLSPGTRSLSCLHPHDSVTHSHKMLKRSMSFSWRAPAQPSGDLRFYITLVQSYFVYWSRIRSAVVHDGTRRSQITESDAEEAVVTTPASDLEQSHKLTPPYTHTHTTPHSLITHTSLASHTHNIQNNTPTSQSPHEHTTTQTNPPHTLHTPQSSAEHATLLPQNKLTTTHSLNTNTTLNEHTATHSNPHPPHHTHTMQTPQSSNERTTAQIDAHPPQKIPGVTRSAYGTQTPQSSNKHTLFKTHTSSHAHTVTSKTPPTETNTLPLSVNTGTHPTNQEAHTYTASVQTNTPHTQLCTAQALPLEPSPALRRAQSESAPTQEAAGGAGSSIKPPSGVYKQPFQPKDTPGAPERGGNPPELEPGHSALELGLLLGLSAALGTAVVMGLRYLQRKHCHKRSAVSLNHRDWEHRGVIHVQECGDLVQVRRIRENSFLVLQSEYNLITPKGN